MYTFIKQEAYVKFYLSLLRSFWLSFWTLVFSSFGFDSRWRGNIYEQKLAAAGYT